MAGRESLVLCAFRQFQTELPYFEATVSIINNGSNFFIRNNKLEAS